ncbi:MAG: PQQ-binding-like beta-propeller repeat protein, partial [Planctomycetaceae bacterium]|nr:PQQ-binding-like beta-propeller repeat protein [Planctomycetaceae bacterium]
GASVVIKNDLVIAPDSEGVLHCLHARTGEELWMYDLFSAVTASPLIVGDWVYVPDEDGDVAIFRLSANPGVAMKQVSGKFRPLAEITMENSIDNTPTFANGVLYIATRTHLWAIAASKKK